MTLGTACALLVAWLMSVVENACSARVTMGAEGRVRRPRLCSCSRRVVVRWTSVAARRHADGLLKRFAERRFRLIAHRFADFRSAALLSGAADRRRSLIVIRVCSEEIRATDRAARSAARPTNPAYRRSGRTSRKASHQTARFLQLLAARLALAREHPARILGGQRAHLIELRRSSAVSATPVAAMLSSSCSTFFAPTITDVTTR